MVEWSTVTVESCLERLTFGKIPKVLTRDYKPSGSYPIVDQGQKSQLPDGLTMTED